MTTAIPLDILGWDTATLGSLITVDGLFFVIDLLKLNGFEEY